MAVITFMSDFGIEDYYVAAVKAKILARSSSQSIIDITHYIKPYDIAHAAIVLKNTYAEFPKGTVHLVAVDNVKETPEPIAIRLNDHYFVGFNTGLFSLISSKPPDLICKLWFVRDSSTFYAKDVLADAALNLAQGGTIDNLGEPLKQLTELFPRQLKATKKEIVGNVVYIDRYGNLITNITQSEFNKIWEMNGEGATFSVNIAREQFDVIHKNYTDVDSGDCFVFFNSSGCLQVGINKGNASQLLGLKMDAPVTVEFSKL